MLLVLVKTLYGQYGSAEGEGLLPDHSLPSFWAHILRGSRGKGLQELVCHVKASVALMPAIVDQQVPHGRQ